MKHTSVITLTVRHSEENILEGETEQLLGSVHGVSNQPLAPLEVWQSWAVLARQLRAMLNPEGFAYAVCDGVAAAMTELGCQSHEDDLRPAIEGPLRNGDQFQVSNAGSYRVVGIREGGELIIRWEPA